MVRVLRKVQTVDGKINDTERADLMTCMGREQLGTSRNTAHLGIAEHLFTLICPISCESDEDDSSD